jgi:Mg-chelatase subunit ChlD
MDMARAGARDAIAAVTTGDCAEVIAFDSAPTRIVPMQPMPATRDRIFAAILAIQPGGGTEIFTALDMAHTDIAATPATRKHVVLVTDGQSPVNWLKELVREMAAGGTTTSTIALGGSTDEKLLQSLASDGGGRFYKVPDPKTLPKIMVKEVALGAK